MVRNPLRTCLLLLGLVVLLPSAARGDDPQRSDAPLVGRSTDARFRADIAPLVKANDFRAILERADAALGPRPDSVPALEYRAYALQHLGRSLEARKGYAKLVEIAPDHAWGRTQLGALLVRLGRPAEGSEHLEHAASLPPVAEETWRKLVVALRTQRLFASAATRVLAAMEAGADPAWGHAELGYLNWATHDLDASRRHWKRARAAGADERLCSHGLELVSLDLLSLDPDPGKAAEMVGRRTGGPGWDYRVGSVQVETRVGPHLPRGFDLLLRRLPVSYKEFLGTQGLGNSRVRIHLARTLEEHEEERRRLFPLGPRGKAFMVRTPLNGTGRGRGGKGRAPDWQLDLYVAWSDPGLRTGVSHEIAHAVLQAGASTLPTWLDEGLATHLELIGDAGPGDPGGARPELTKTLREGLQAGKTLPLTDLCAGYGPWSGNVARLRYAQSWSLVGFLLRKDEAAFREVLATLRQRPRDPLSVLRSAFGDLDALEREWLASIEP